MSEYWKSTPKYSCKYCNVFVRDTPLERANHEKTGKHQGALKRFLRDLHRNHDQEQREKDRAQREIDRLNGVVSQKSGSSSAAKKPLNLEDDRRRQREQLAAMGVAMPEEVRSGMAMAGEWTVTATRVIEEKTDEGKKEARVVGVRKREITEQEKEEEEAVRGLFKKPRTWGRDSKVAFEGGGGDDDGLEALLAGGIKMKTVKDEEAPEKTGEGFKMSFGKVKKEEDETDDITVKKEEDTIAEKEEDINVKKEEDEPVIKQAEDIPPVIKNDPDSTQTEPTEPAITFKKRKPKNIRKK